MKEKIKEVSSKCQGESYPSLSGGKGWFMLEL